MRIKKKQIKEGLDMSTIDDTVKSTEEMKGSFQDMGIDEPKAADLAANIVSSAFSDDEVNEEAVSDSQRKFFNAVHKCKTEGDCGSESIKKAAEGMSLKDIEDFAFTKGKLPDSVDEDSPTGEDFEDIPTGRDLEVDADEYEERQEILKQVSGDGPTIDLDSVEDGLPFESVRPKMTKSELTEAVKNIGKNIKYPRSIVKTFKVKDLRK